MSNLRAKTSSSAEEFDVKSVGHSSQGYRSSLGDRAKLAALKARRQVKVNFSERIVKIKQELAELEILESIQADKAAFDAIDMVDQDISYNQAESKSIIGQSADLQNYSSGISSQHPQSISYSVPVCVKSEVITSSYSYSPLVTSLLSHASNVTSLASVYTSSCMSVQPAIDSKSLANHDASYSVPSSRQSNFHGLSPHISLGDRSHLDNVRLSSQAPICHTGDGYYFSSASPQNPSHVSQEYRANQSQLGSFPHPYRSNGFSTQQTLPGAYVNASHVLPPQQFQSGYNTCPSFSRRPLPEPRQFSWEDLSDFLDYSSWRYSFQTLIQNSGISNSERIYYFVLLCQGYGIRDY